MLVGALLGRPALRHRQLQVQLGQFVLEQFDEQLGLQDIGIPLTRCCRHEFEDLGLGFGQPLAGVRVRHVEAAVRHARDGIQPGTSVRIGELGRHCNTIANARVESRFPAVSVQ